MRRTAFIHNAAHPHLATLDDPAVKAMSLVDGYVPDLKDGMFDEFDSVYVASRLHPSILRQITPQLVEFLSREGTKLYVDGENAVGTWLPGTTETRRGTNFWAWRTGEDVGRRSVNQDHPFWENLTDYSVHWHYHSVLTHPETAVPLVRLEPVDDPLQTDDPWGIGYRALPDHPNTLLYYDAGSFPGEVVVSSMDASFHHGSGFMPGATQLLYRMLHWLRS